MNKKRLVFILISLLFFALVGVVVWDMSRQTTAPWEKKKQQEQAH